MKYGFIKVAAASPKICVADPFFNVSEMINTAKRAAEYGVTVLVFPELSITGYTCGDLFFSDALISGAENALKKYLEETTDLPQLSVVGLPVEHKGKLYNCGAVCRGGEVLGLVPKCCNQTVGAPGEDRFFANAPLSDASEFVTLLGEEIPFGTNQIFYCEQLPALKLAVEIGSDALMPYSPAISYAAAGATLIVNPAAIPEQVGVESYLTEAMKSCSAMLHTAHVTASAGQGESTTDMVFGGRKLICENGKLLASASPFSADTLLCTEVDVSLLNYERRRAKSSADAPDYWEIPFSLPLTETPLTRSVSPHPFIPDDPAECAPRFESILEIQAAGLRQRVERAFAKKLVVGISGGLDSTLALLVMARAMDALNRPRTDIVAVTMPCFGTTVRTKTNATVLCEELGVDFRCVDIFDAVNVHFRDIGHDPADRNVTYENAQARERTQILMDIANDCGGMVIGTGDLSELALGWATYNGDQMSMYGVNAAIPKTLVRHLVSHAANRAEAEGNQKLADALRDVVGTPVSPELLPADESGEIAQKTEDLVGPYEIHDFYLYYMLRYGFSPAKLYRLAQYALGDTYDRETLLKWLKTLLRRFFTQQFKRSCMPDGPAVGSVGLSPRGGWQMPSDASFALWMAEAETL